MHRTTLQLRQLADDLERLIPELRPTAEALLDERISTDLAAVADIIGAAAEGDLEELLINAPQESVR